MTQAAGTGEGAAIEPRVVSTGTATAIAIADMVGIGVFTSLGFQLIGVPSAFPIMMLWIVGGLAALSGALAYAELSAAMPRSGGEYVFLSRIYHPAIGFMAGWVSATVGFAAPVALAAMAFGEYFAGALPGSPPIVMGLAVVWGVTLIHLLGLRHGTVLQNVSTAIKLAMIFAFIVAGFMVDNPQPISFLPEEGDVALLMSAPFAVSLVYVMYAYSGWNAAVYISGEVSDPGRSLPRALIVATSFVIILYVVLNAVFLYSTPIDAMKGQLNVAQVAGDHIFGPLGGRIVAGLICFGLISTISAMMWIGPRVTMAMGEDALALRAFASRTSRGVPAVAVMFQLVVASALLVTQSFEAVLEYIQFSLTFCSFLAVLGVVILRFSEPDLPRPYKVWAHPITPLIFLGVTGYMLYFLAEGRPLQSLASLATLASGVAVYFLSKRFSQH